MEDIKRILVVTRSTRNCRKAVHMGASLARQYGASLYVMDVMTDPFSIKGWNLPIPSLEKEYQKTVEVARKELHKAIESEKVEGLPVKDWISEGNPVDEVLRVVKDENIDLLILLAHDEWRLEHFLFGRTNHELLRTMPCSVLFVKQDAGGSHGR